MLEKCDLRLRFKLDAYNSIFMDSGRKFQMVRRHRTLSPRALFLQYGGYNFDSTAVRLLIKGH